MIKINTKNYESKKTFKCAPSIVISWHNSLYLVNVLRTTHHKAHHVDAPDDGFPSSCLQQHHILPTLVVVHPPAETAPWIRTSQRGRDHTAFLLHSWKWQQTRRRAWGQPWEEMFLSASTVSINAKQEPAAVRPGVYRDMALHRVTLVFRTEGLIPTWHQVTRPLRWLPPFTTTWYRPVTCKSWIRKFSFIITQTLNIR